MPAPSLRRAAAHARVLTLTAVTAAALAACGGGGDAATPDASSTAATAAATRTTAFGIPAAPVRAAGDTASKGSAKGTDHEAATASATQALRRALAAPRAGDAAVLAVDAATAAAQLLDYAEAQLPGYFPTREATQQFAPFAFRHYPDTGIYLGVVLADGAGYPAQGVYVMGGPFGDAPVAVGQLTDYVTPAPYTVALSTDKALVQQGQSTTVRVTLTRAPGFTGAVQVSLGGLPAGVTAGTATIAANATSAELVLSAQASTPHSLPATAHLTASATGAQLHKPLSVTVRGAAGSVDTSFGGGVQTTPIGYEDYANAVAVQPDGKVVVAGSSSSNAGTFVTLVRYGRDGGLDTTFGNGGKLVTPVGASDDAALALAVQADGRIVVVGSTEQAATGQDFLVLRYLADGSLDPSFGSGGKVITSFGDDSDRALAVAIQPDGKIVVGGESQSGASTSGIDFALARYLPNGTLDPAFGSGGKVVTAISSYAGRDSIYALALPVVDGEQRILAVGGEGNFQAARYRANGQLDAGFGSGGKVTDLFNASIGSARSVVLLPGGQAVLAGSVANDFAAVQLTVQGTLDGSFGTGGRFVHAVSAGNWDSATALVRQADGKLVLGGWVYAGNSSAGDFAALRLNANGQLDTSFGNAGVAIHPTAAGLKSDIAHGLVLQADPRVPTVRAIQAGEASGSNYDFSVIRLWL
jgi:uncharacterized delta-60 repeat protein